MCSTIMITAAGTKKGNITMDQIRLAIKEFTTLDEEDGYLSVGLGCCPVNSVLLTTISSLDVIYSSSEYFVEKIKAKVNSLEVVEELYELLLASNFEQVKLLLRNIDKTEQKQLVWVVKCSTDEIKITLKAYRDSTVIYHSIEYYEEQVEDVEENIKVELGSWEEVEELYALFLDSKFDRVREILRSKIDQETKPG